MTVATHPPSTAACRAESPPAAVKPSVSDQPQLAPGVELIGEYQGSGYAEPFFLARRADGQVIQLSRLLYVVAGSLDGHATLEEIADRTRHQTGRPVSAANVEYLVEHKLRRLGVAVDTAATSAPAPRARPLLGLTVRSAVFPARVVSRASAALTVLFAPAVVVAVLACVAIVDAWLLVGGGVTVGLGEALSDPLLTVAVLGLMGCSAMFHEFGHAAACRYGGARPGAIGAGIYLIWPVFYSDVTDCYRLSRMGRLRTDVGGLYFNAIFVVAIAIAYVVTGSAWLLVVIVAQHLVVLQQCLPIVRLDGYYIVSDLTGVPDLFVYIKPILLSMVPGRRSHPAIRRLKPRVRMIVAGWVVLTVLMITATLVMLIPRAPQLLATAKDSLNVQAELLAAALRAGQPLLVVPAVIEIALLAVATVGIAVLSWRIARSASRSALGVARRATRRNGRGSNVTSPPAARVPRPRRPSLPPYAARRSRRKRNCQHEYDPHDRRPAPHPRARGEQPATAQPPSTPAGTTARATAGGPHRVILGPRERRRGLCVTGVEFYDDRILVRWQIAIPTNPQRPASSYEQIEQAHAQQMPTFTLHDDDNTTYRSLGRRLPVTAVITDAGTTTARGTQLFSPTPPSDIRLLRLQVDDRQFEVHLT